MLCLFPPTTKDMFLSIDGSSCLFKTILPRLVGFLMRTETNVCVQSAILSQNAQLSCRVVDSGYRTSINWYHGEVNATIPFFLFPLHFSPAGPPGK